MSRASSLLDRFHRPVVDPHVVDQAGEEGADRLVLAAADVLEELAVVLPAAAPVFRTDGSTSISVICRHFLRRIPFFSRSGAKNGLAFGQSRALDLPEQPKYGIVAGQGGTRRQKSDKAMRFGDRTDMGGPGDEFLTTHWSLIDHMGENQDKDRALIGTLIQRYWKPVYCYLHRKGYRNDEAKDLTQSFFHEIVLNRHLLERADPSRGRFRTFLLHALDEFLIDQRRKDTTGRRIPKDKLVPLDVADLPSLPPAALEGSEADCFTYAWKTALIDQTLAEVHAACQNQGLEVHWRVFEAHVLHPIYHDEKPPSMREICTRYGIASESVASNMLITVKRRFREAMRRNLRLTVLSESDVDDEIREIQNLVGKGAQDSAQLLG